MSLSDPAYRFESKAPNDERSRGHARYAAHGSRAADSTRRLRIPFRIRIPFADLVPRGPPIRGPGPVAPRCRIACRTAVPRWDLGPLLRRSSGVGCRARRPRWTPVVRRRGREGSDVAEAQAWPRTDTYRVPISLHVRYTRRFTQTTTAAILSHLLMADATSVGAREPSVKIASKLRAGHVSII